MEETCELTLVAKIQIRAVGRGKHFWPMEWFAEFMKHASAFHSPELQSFWIVGTVCGASEGGQWYMCEGQREI